MQWQMNFGVMIVKLMIEKREEVTKESSCLPVGKKSDYLSAGLLGGKL